MKYLEFYYLYGVGSVTIFNQMNCSFVAEFQDYVVNFCKMSLPTDDRGGNQILSYSSSVVINFVCLNWTGLTGDRGCASSLIWFGPNVYAPIYVQQTVINTRETQQTSTTITPNYGWKDWMCELNSTHTYTYCHNLNFYFSTLTKTSIETETEALHILIYGILCLLAVFDLSIQIFKRRLKGIAPTQKREGHESAPLLNELLSEPINYSGPQEVPKDQLESLPVPELDNSVDRSVNKQIPK